MNKNPMEVPGKKCFQKIHLKYLISDINIYVVDFDITLSFKFKTQSRNKNSKKYGRINAKSWPNR